MKGIPLYSESDGSFKASLTSFCFGFLVPEVEEYQFKRNPKKIDGKTFLNLKNGLNAIIVCEHEEKHIPKIASWGFKMYQKKIVFSSTDFEEDY